MEGVTPLPPRLLDYDCYRAFLRDFYAHKKAARSGFSYRAFAARAGFRSPNYLQLVMQGKRNLSSETTAKVGLAMGLKAEERQLFAALVDRAGATGPEQDVKSRQRYFAAKKKVASVLVPREQREILARWHHLAILELATLKGFEPTGAWISRRLGGLVSETDADASIAFLLRTGFLSVDPGSGRLKQSEPSIDTGDAFQEAFVLNYHQNTLSVWIRALQRLRPEERELGLLNIPIRRERIAELKARMRAFQDEIIGWLQDETEPDALVQLGTYLVPLTVAGDD